MSTKQSQPQLQTQSTSKSASNSTHSTNTNTNTNTNKSSKSKPNTTHKPSNSQPQTSILSQKIKYKRFEGSQQFRQRLLLATLTATPIIITNIRHLHENPGIRGEK